MPVKRKAWQLRLGDQLAGDDDGQPGHDYINYSFLHAGVLFRK